MCKPFSEFHVLWLSCQSHEISLQNECSVFLLEEEFGRLVRLALEALLGGKRGGAGELLEAVVSCVAGGRGSWRPISALGIVVVAVGPLTQLPSVEHHGELVL